MGLTEQESHVLMALVKAAEYVAQVTQPDNSLRDKLRLIYEKLDCGE